MKVLDARIRDHSDTYNPHRLELLVDAMPDTRQMRHEMLVEKDAIYYFANEGGYVHFGVHHPGNERGYGGAIVEVTDTEGVVYKFRGPWSSRPEVMFVRFGIKSVPCSITDDPRVFEKGYTFFAADVDLNIVYAATKLIHEATDILWYPVEVPEYGERPIKFVRENCEFAYDRRQVNGGTWHAQTGLCINSWHRLEVKNVSA